MIISGKHYRTIWLKESNKKVVQIINQRALPHSLEIMDLATVEDVKIAIKDMYIRGAGSIGAAAGYGMYLAALEASEADFDDDIRVAGTLLKSTRPTASNLAWAVHRQLQAISEGFTANEKRKIALETAEKIAIEDSESCRQIGLYGQEIIARISRKKAGKTVNILTHCNAGWLAFVDYGTALSPVYAARNAGIDIHVWVDETRPRNQGASLTAWELGQEGVKHTLIVDNTGGHLMQQGLVDLIITGADRVSRNGDVANKIGTYLKALAAKDNNIPFYVALPLSTFDLSLKDGVKEIPIEERDASEVRYIWGKTDAGVIEKVLVCPDSTPARNWGFDITPARLITKLITERGICNSNRADIQKLFHKGNI